jgi:hypothetical protein
MRHLTIRFAFLLVLASTVGCTFDPDLPDGLCCSEQGSCPPQQTCTKERVCCRNPGFCPARQNNSCGPDLGTTPDFMRVGDLMKTPMACPTSVLVNGQQVMVDGALKFEFGAASQSPPNTVTSPRPDQIVLHIRTYAQVGPGCKGVVHLGTEYNISATIQFKNGASWSVYEDQPAGNPIGTGKLSGGGQFSFTVTKEVENAVAEEDREYWVRIDSNDAQANNTLSIAPGKARWYVKGDPKIYETLANLPYRTFTY